MIKIRSSAIFLITIALFLLNAVPRTLNPVYAAVPHLLNYQGRLTDASGVPLNGSYTLNFKIYDALAAGVLKWEETQSGVVIQKGVFNILLGSVTALDLPFDKPYFLEIKVGNEVMSPRQQITSAGYAIRAETADVAEKVKATSSDTTAGYLDTKVKNSIEVNSNQIQLKNDNATPGSNKYYGTDVSANKGFFTLAWVPTNIQVFTVSGTWIKPAGVTSVFVKVVGGGGGGGACDVRTSAASGGGGGGAYAEGVVAVTGNVTVNVGVGGVGGDNGASGNSGGDSGFGAYVIAKGGGGGASSSGGDGGAGGSGASSTGVFKISGSGGVGGSSNDKSSGIGGASGLGFGGQNDFGAGLPGKNYGGGGNGRVANAGIGGAGAPGVVIVYY